MEFQLHGSINVGKIETLVYGKQAIQTALRNAPVQEEIFLSSLGFEGDEQAYEDHGGVDKAVCIYPYDHYSYWQPLLHNFVNDALFGENMTVKGLTEDKVHIDDVFSVGDAVIQVTEPRNPCYKLAKKYEVPDLAVQMLTKGYTGFLCRVLQEGWVSPDPTIKRIEAHPAGVTVQLVNEVKFHDKGNEYKIRQILAVSELGESIRNSLERRLF